MCLFYANEKHVKQTLQLDLLVLFVHKALPDLANNFNHCLDAVAVCEVWIGAAAPDAAKFGLAPTRFNISHVHRTGRPSWSYKRWRSGVHQCGLTSVTVLLNGAFFFYSSTLHYTYYNYLPSVKSNVYL